MKDWISVLRPKINLSEKRSSFSGFPSWLSGLRTRLVSMRIWVQSLALLSGLRIQLCHALQYRSQTPMLLGLWCRPAGAAPIRPLAWELPYASGAKLPLWSSVSSEVNNGTFLKSTATLDFQGLCRNVQFTLCRERFARIFTQSHSSAKLHLKLVARIFNSEYTQHLTLCWEPL